jgi:hypothetical protein
MRFPGLRHESSKVDAYVHVHRRDRRLPPSNRVDYARSTAVTLVILHSHRYDIG